MVDVVDAKEIGGTAFIDGEFVHATDSDVDDDIVVKEGVFVAGDDTGAGRPSPLKSVPWRPPPSLRATIPAFLTACSTSESAMPILLCSGSTAKAMK